MPSSPPPVITDRSPGEPRQERPPRDEHGPSSPPASPATRPRVPVPVVVVGAAVALVALGGVLLLRAESKTNEVALASSPKPVSFVTAASAEYHPTRAYVGRIDPWVSASVGPQLVSAYVDTVLVRPGAVVKKGEVLATLDCRNASATQQSIALRARSLDAQEKAVSHEAARVDGLLDGGFVSPNEAEQKSAQSAAKQAEVLAEKAKLLGTSLEVNDCILRAPFEGDVALRTIDPGAFVRPGSSIVTVVNRDTVRMTADVPENDFAVVEPLKKARVLAYATGRVIDATITRRAPAADPGTRTVHVEVDIADPSHTIPVGTTGELRVDAGEPLAATAIPLASATVRDTKATVFLVTGGVAHAKTFTVLGESAGRLFARPSDVSAGAEVVTEGRALLADGDRVDAKQEAPIEKDDDAAPLAEGGGR